MLTMTSLRSLLTCAAVMVLAAVGGMGLVAPARADSGEPADTQGVYRASCTALRTISGVQADTILACDADRRSCELVRTAPVQVNEGLPVGFCADTFPNVRPIRFAAQPPADPALETGVKIRATSFGVDSGYFAPSPVSKVSDIVCSTFVGPTAGGKKPGAAGPGIRVCRKIVAGGNGGPTCDNNDFLVTRSSDCAELRSQLANSVTADQFTNLSHALLFDVDKAGLKGSVGLLVCQPFGWECVNPANAQQLGVKAQYQFPFSVIQTPVCITMNRRTYCG
jgi:hypothetical protein